jgi:hypothetical protein
LAKVAKTVAKPKKAKMSSFRTQFASPKYLHLITFKTEKYLHKPCLEARFIGKKVEKSFNKSSPNSQYLLGYFIFPPKIKINFKKLPNWSIIDLSGHPTGSRCLENAF